MKTFDSIGRLVPLDTRRKPPRLQADLSYGDPRGVFTVISLNQLSNRILALSKVLHPNVRWGDVHSDPDRLSLTVGDLGWPGNPRPHPDHVYF